MLMKILQEMAHGKTASYASLAEKFGVAEGMIEQAMFDLKRMGYIRNIVNEDCAPDACKHCVSSCSDVRPVSAAWELTEKGKKRIG